VADDFDPTRLTEQLRLDRQNLEYPRARREQMVRALAGKDWSEETSADLTEPVNLLDLYVKVITPNLIAQGPRVLLSTFDAESKPAVAGMQRWLNLEVERTDFAETIQRVATDALFSVGICKVALATPEESATLAWRQQAGQPFVEPIDLDDFVFDRHARRWADCHHIGHRIRRPLKAVKANGLYSKDRLSLTPSYDPAVNPQGDQRVKVLGGGWRGAYTPEAEDMVDLWEVYLPRERRVVTFRSDDGSDPIVGSDGGPLRNSPWVGPEVGPYHVLGYGLVPGNCMPKGTVQALYRIHEVVNHVYRKLIRQAERQKEVLGVEGSADQDGSRIVNASDGDAIRLDNPKNAQLFKFGGPDAMNFQFGDHLRNTFSTLAGNMDAFGGLSPQAKTARQDELLMANASRLITDMQARTVAFTAKVLKALCWFHWEHPFNVQTYEHVPAGGRRGFPRSIHPRDAVDRFGRPQTLRRQQAFDKIDLRVDPYSVVPQPPSARLKTLLEVLQVWAPFAPLSAQQGVMPDWNFFFSKLAEYTDSPDLAGFLTTREPIQPGGGEGPTMPAQTQRTYTRENVPMRTDKGASQQLQASLSGVDTGGAQKNGQTAQVGQ
jgi:hypothetical protein